MQTHTMPVVAVRILVRGENQRCPFWSLPRSQLTHPDDSVGDGGRFGSTVEVASVDVGVGVVVTAAPPLLGGFACAAASAKRVAKQARIGKRILEE